MMKSYEKNSVKFLAGICLLALVSFSVHAGNTYEGYMLYNQTCYLCHGDSGKGDGPLAGKIDISITDLTDDKLVNETSDLKLFRLIQGTIKHGSGNNMPQWGLALAGPQIESIISYVRFLQRSKHSLPGDPRIGEQVYRDNCVACHGRLGKGDGILTTVMKMNAADHTSSMEMNKHPNSQLIEIVTNGTPGKSLMPGWKEKLSSDEIEGVVAYIRLLSTYR
ncbi:MAG: c-type cytochrome [Candidatus Thiodiazotropha sp. (ex Monitilora ramsayi)]|nr:c-type cytochrome [Candidatus Thiodiazotropha sp. (ex Monitilora ramsayi)]